MDNSKEYIKNAKELEMMDLKDRIKKLETTTNVLNVLCNIYAKANGIKIEQLPGDTRLIVISQIG